MTQAFNLALDVKALGSREFEGHGSVAKNIDLGGDIVMPGAFRKSLAEHKQSGSMPLMFWMHKPDMVPGVWTEMREDDKGLYVKGELVDTQLGNEMRTLLRKNAVRGLSIGYQIRDFDFDKDGNRLLKEVDLWEVSIVSLAMNPLAQVEAAKSRLSGSGEYVPTEREFEQRLRASGCSKSVSRFIIAKIYDGAGDLPARQFDDEGAGGMPGRSRWDAGHVEPEAEDVLGSIGKWTDKFGAAALKRY